MLAFVLVIALSAIAVLLGATSRTRPRPDRAALITVVSATGALALVLLLVHDDAVPDKDLVLGVLLGAVFGGVLPFALFYALGRLLVERRVLALTCLALLVPLGFYAYLVTGFTLDLTNCPRGKVDCLAG